MMFNGLTASVLLVVVHTEHILLLVNAEAAASENTLHQLRRGGIESLAEKTMISRHCIAKSKQLNVARLVTLVYDEGLLFIDSSSK